MTQRTRILRRTQDEEREALLANEANSGYVRAASALNTENVRIAEERNREGDSQAG